MSCTLSDALFPLTLSAPGFFVAAITIALITAGVAYARRRALPPAASRSVLGLFAIGLLLLSLAAGGLAWRHRKMGSVAVMVDLSASTRTAAFRNPQFVERRLDVLLRGTPYVLREMSSDRAPRTIFDPPAGADVVVLFSDGRFNPPPVASSRASPAVYPVVDTSLDRPADAAVERLELRDGNRQIAATVRSEGEAARTLHFSGADPARQSVPAGRTVLAATVQGRAAERGPVGHRTAEHGAVGQATTMQGNAVQESAGTTGGRQAEASNLGASLSPRDPWPENDELMLRVPPPAQLERWWVGAVNRASGVALAQGRAWRPLNPANLPNDAADYLSAGVIVLDNVAADDLTPVQRERLEQYVRDLGGGLVIVGGDRAFAAGGYVGTALDRLSPLASTPPAPTTHWVLLADSSGSMARRLGDNPRWNFAAAAIAAVVPLLPPDDPISIGNFARQTRWWHTARPLREVQRDFAVPKDIIVTGPTRLAAALEAIALASTHSANPATGASPDPAVGAPPRPGW